MSIPGFNVPTMQQQQRQSRYPHSFSLGDVDIPWNVPKLVWQWRAPLPVRLLQPTIYCGEIVSPSGCPVVIEAWKNGTYGGTTTLQTGPNRYEGELALGPMDTLQLKVCVRGESTGDTSIRDMWILFVT